MIQKKKKTPANQPLNHNKKPQPNQTKNNPPTPPESL